MIETVLCSLLLSALALPAPGTPAGLPRPAASPPATEPAALRPPGDDGDDGDEVPDKREDIEQLLATMKAHVKERGREDREAIAIIDQLLQEFARCGPKDRASIVKEVSKALEAKRQDKDDGTTDNQLFRAVAVALGGMGPESAKPLASWIGDKRHRKDLALQRDLILALGKTRDEKSIDTLVDLLSHHEASLQAAAAEALANYADSEIDTRKDVFESILKALTAAKSQMDGNINDVIARERYDTISGSMITTLQLLSGHTERKPEEWQRWWNKNKKGDWDKEAQPG